MKLTSDIREHYFYSHPQNNPKRIVPKGPKLDIEPLNGGAEKRKADDVAGSNKAAKV